MAQLTHLSSVSIMGSLPEDLTAEALLQSPSLMLHRQRDFDRNNIRAYDGLVAAVVDDGNHIVTTPNCTAIRYPPLGSDRPLFLRDNLRYADDDPLMWPQPLNLKLPYLSVIRYPPRDETDPLRIMWAFPEEQDFTREDSVLSGLGRFSSSLVARLRAPCIALIGRAQQTTYKDHPTAQELGSLIPLFLERLTVLPMSLRRAQITVREVQRMFLELQAFVDWQDIYESRMNGQVVADPAAPVARVIGAFTTNVGLCEDLYRAKIPAFLIRPYHVLAGMCISEVVTALRPDGNIPMLPATQPSYATIYRGSATSEEKYMAMRRFTRFFHAYPNPFNSHRVEPRAEPLPSSSSLTDRKARTAQYSPYAQRTKPKAALFEAAGRNKFEDLPDPILPPPIPAWRDALRKVDRSKSNFVDHDVLSSDFGYAFPEPASFIAYERKDRRDSAFRSWLRYRDAFIHRFSFEESDARPMSGKAWRELLGFDWTEKTSSTRGTSSAPGIPSTTSAPSTSSASSAGKKSSKIAARKAKSSSRRELLEDFLRTCLKNEGVDLQDVVPGNETWQGKAFNTLQDQDFEEILWEIGELNFRQELLALDLRIAKVSDPSSDPIHRQASVAGCFPGGQLLIAPLCEANHGLSSYDDEERCRYLLELQRLMRAWPGSKLDILGVDQIKWRTRDIEDLELAVATFYTQTFYNYFRRAPVIPRRLSHNVPGFIVPPSTLQIVNPRPNMYYDLTRLPPYDPAH